MTYEHQYSRYCELVQETLEALLGTEAKGVPASLLEAMRYSVFAGGKRLRPVLLLAAGEMLGAPADELRVPAAALEMIHTYSLIHDDLPGMDNDDYRRGRLTNHKVFGEGHAILAGDALLNYAYECLQRNALQYKDHLLAHVRAISAISSRAGVRGMIAGQEIDLQSEHQTPSLDSLVYIHAHKTADLLTAPLEAAGYIAVADEDTMNKLRRIGYAMGMAFQIDDDLLDVIGDAQTLGKQTGMDAERGKMTWPSLAGIAASQEKALTLWKEAEEGFCSFGKNGEFLCRLVQAMSNRKK